MYTQVSHCPRCGAPIYVQTVWHAVTPPPNVYSCNCFPHPGTTYSTGTNIKVTNKDHNDEY